ncbi:MAG TPA: NCS1 family nucleobase:cation symporter-1 [Haliangium sp.]|nr:NCS1 family nucleobase:cation symporter-1 [Haliangium sp.]
MAASDSTNSLINDDLAPTSPAQRTWSLWHIAALWVGIAICIPTYMLASGLVDQGWSLGLAVASVALGNLIVLVPMVLNAHAGTRYGIPFPVLLRASFGVLGANVPAMMRALVACGWFGIQTWIGGMAIYTLVGALVPETWTLPNVLPAWMGINTGQLVAFLVFWAINVAIIVRGIDTIRVLETWSAPFLLAIGVALFAWAWLRVGDLGAMLADPPGATGFDMDKLAVGLTIGVSYWGTLALNIPDFSRFARSQKDQVVGQALGLPATMAMFAFIGAAVTNATAVIFGARIADPVALLARIGGPALTVLSLVGLAVATLTTNLAANIVSPANDFSNLAPRRISFRQGAIIASAIGAVIMPWKLLSNLGNYLFVWLGGYGGMLGAVGGIMIADYYLIRRGQLDIDALYRRGGAYEYSGGFHVTALVALATGIAPNVPGFLGALGVVTLAPDSAWTTIYSWAWFVGFFLAGAVYLGGTALTRRRQ